MFLLSEEPSTFFVLQALCLKSHTLQTEPSEKVCTLGLDITESAVCNFLSKVGFTCQRLATYALQRDEDLRRQFVTDVLLYAQDTLIFIDETGTNCTDTLRKFSYSLRGKPVRAQKLLVRGEHVSAIATISTKGLLALKIVRGALMVTCSTTLYVLNSFQSFCPSMGAIVIACFSSIIAQFTMYKRFSKYLVMLKY